MKTRGVMLTPSLMCADHGCLNEKVKELDLAGADAFHIDVMDGHFVPNFAMGTQDIEAVRNATKKILDIHLMIDNPENYVELFCDLGADIIYFHPESTKQPYNVISCIKKRNVKCGVALSPGTSIDSVIELIAAVDYVLVMTVNPGFSGQDYLNLMDLKVQKLVKLKNDLDFILVADGALSETRIKKLIKMGVDGFVLGTSVLFKKESRELGYTHVFDTLRLLYENK